MSLIEKPTVRSMRTAQDRRGGKRWTLLAAMTLGAGSALQCGHSDLANVGAGVDARVDVTPDTMRLAIGQVAQLDATLTAVSAGMSTSGARLKWLSSQTSVATVDSTGLVRGASAGTAHIVASVGTHADTSTVIVGQQGQASVDAACASNPAPSVPAPVRTLYIDAQSGDDAADGLGILTAWKTIAKANASARPGDLFLLSGMFRNEYIRPAASGTATAKIVYRVRPGSQAVLNGGQYATIVWLDGRSHVVIDGLELRNEENPVMIRAGASQNWLRRLWIHDLSSMQILQSSDNRIEDSRIEHCGNEQANAGDCIWIADDANRNVIARNQISYAGHSTVAVGGDRATMAPSYDNLILQNDLSNPWAANAFVLGRGERTVIECNRIHHSSTDGVNYARSGLQINANQNVIRYNEIFANTADGIQIQAYTYQGLVQNAVGNQIYHNTVWGNGGAGLMLLQKDVGQVRDNAIQNNIFWENQRSSDPNVNRFFEGSYQDIWVDLYHSDAGWPDGSLNGNIIRNNIVAKGPTIDASWLIIVRRTTNLYYTMAQAQSMFSTIGSNQQGDPLMTNPAGTDFRLRETSPAIDAGRPIPGVKFIGAAPDIGAHELK